MTDRGIVFFLAAAGRRGALHALHLRVAIMTLRESGNDGPVFALAGDDEATVVCSDIAADGRSGQFKWCRFNFNAENERCYAAKTRIRDWSPFSKTIYCDCDVTFHGSFEELWPINDELVVTQFSDWRSKGRKIAGRIDSWKEQAPDLVAKAHQSDLPGINTGVFSFTPKTTFFEPWRELCSRDPHKFIGDESALQVLIGNIGGWRCVDGRFNSSPIYGPHADVRVRHYHGVKSFRRQASAAEYKVTLQRAIDTDFAGTKEVATKLSLWP